MNEETKNLLYVISKGRKDLVDIYNIIESGYGGILSDGSIVDRLEYPEAIPLQRNLLFNTPEPKNIDK